jgi:hypothetical protein
LARLRLPTLSALGLSRSSTPQWDSELGGSKWARGFAESENAILRIELQAQQQKNLKARARAAGGGDTVTESTPTLPARGPSDTTE